MANFRINQKSLNHLIIENYLKMLTQEEPHENPKQLSPIVESLRGSFKLPKKEMDYKKELSHRMVKKYIFQKTKE
ncbi:MAG: DUF6364 family protein [Sediminicola sp.]